MSVIAGRAQGRRGQTPLWIAATAGLLALGFSRRDAQPRQSADGEAAPQPASSPGRSGSEQTAARDAHGDERGRSASTPSQIPKRGWKDILKRCYQRLNDDRILAIAAGVTFYALLAIFPAIAALVSIYGLFADPVTIAQHLDDISGMVPGGAIDVIRGQLESLTSKGNSALGLAFVVGLAISLWSANSGVKAMMDALNVAYAEREKRGFFRLNATSFMFTLAGIAAIIIGLGALVVMPLMIQYLGLDSQKWVAEAIKWPVLLVVVMLAISLLYRYAPSRREAKWRWITWGSAAATIGWIAISILFSWYAANFGSYNKTYGSLGAVVGFMTWIWLSVTIILLGAELDAEMERQTERDTTVGSPKPMGQRGAAVADTKGPAKA
ncbi:MAG: YihY/virulence factor BrkB family protein [Hyphomicrobiales bacterium]|nr:YihY/virulence factor BrkB family protein [Hyphomicrobiales bacterium]MBV8824776.1 YihY/virulence factor BrkB family protein [Hyphomicrobiales bacterium]MBV9428679.1 YihY/virulence factor BrkB family protein [Bradyrhizobiaceae bacterium]